MVIKAATSTKSVLHQEAGNFLEKTAVFPLMSLKISKMQRLPAVVGTALARESQRPFDKSWWYFFEVFVPPTGIMPACKSLLIML